MTHLDYPLSSWSFDESVSPEFDKHVRQSVPEYEELQKAIVRISDFFIQQNGVIYDIGCSTGETIYHIHQRHLQKNIHFIGIDDSNFMLKEAFKKNKHANHIELVNQSIENYEFTHKSNLIVCILTLQFVPIEHRKSVLKKVYESLNTGGAFLLVEKVYAESSKIQEMFTQIYHDEKEQNGLTATEIRSKDKSLRGVLNPLTLQENMNLLHSVGFKTVEVFSKHLNFTGFIAIK